MIYPADFSVLVLSGQVHELRFERPGYKYEGKLEVGSPLDDVLKMMGPPRKTVKGEKIGFENHVLYLDTDGRPGWGYYEARDKNVRVFLTDGKVNALYVMRPTGFTMRSTSNAEDEKFLKTIQAKVDGFNIDKTTFDDVVKTFGEPVQYVWGNETYARGKLPERFILRYPAGFAVFMSKGNVVELRFEAQPAYVWRSKLHVGSTLKEVLDVLGEPKRTVKDEKCTFEDRVLYLNMDDEKGHDYYADAQQHIRMFFVEDRVIALYVTR